MSNKTHPGYQATQLAIDDTVPTAGAGVSLIPFSGAYKTDRWMITTEIVEETPTDATLDLDTVADQLDTIVAASGLFPGSDGNVIQVASVGDSDPGAGVTIEEDLDNLTVTIHFEDGVSTVLDVENAITANATLIVVDTAGTPADVLAAPGDEFEETPLAGGSASTNAYNVVVWGRDGTTKRWGRHNDAYGTIKNGELITAAEGRQHFFMRDLGNYDRVAFTRDDVAPADIVNVTVTEILMAGRGN